MSLARRCLLDLLGPAGDEDGLIDQVEDDRAHTEAEKLRKQADEVEQSPLLNVDPGVVLHTAGVLRTAAKAIDPYEMRDGQLVRKSDGKPVTV